MTTTMDTCCTELQNKAHVIAANISENIITSAASNVTTKLSGYLLKVLHHATFKIPVNLGTFLRSMELEIARAAKLLKFDDEFTFVQLREMSYIERSTTLPRTHTELVDYEKFVLAECHRMSPNFNEYLTWWKSIMDLVVSGIDKHGLLFAVFVVSHIVPKAWDVGLRTPLHGRSAISKK